MCLVESSSEKHVVSNLDELKEKVRYDVVMLFVSAAAAALAAKRTVSSMCLFGDVCSCRNREKRERGNQCYRDSRV